MKTSEFSCGTLSPTVIRGAKDVGGRRGGGGERRREGEREKGRGEREGIRVMRVFRNNSLSSFLMGSVLHSQYWFLK